MVYVFLSGWGGGVEGRKFEEDKTPSLCFPRHRGYWVRRMAGCDVLKRVLAGCVGRKAWAAMFLLEAEVLLRGSSANACRPSPWSTDTAAVVAVRPSLAFSVIWVSAGLAPQPAFLFPSLPPVLFSRFGPEVGGGFGHDVTFL